MNFAKLTDAQTGNPILIRLDDVQAVTETVPGMKPEGRRLFCRGSVLVVKETVEDVESKLLAVHEEEKRKERETELFARSLGDQMVEAARTGRRETEASDESDKELPTAQLEESDVVVRSLQTARAKRVTKDGVFDNGYGKTYVRAGGYVVETHSGHGFSVPEEEFLKNYVRVTE